MFFKDLSLGSIPRHDGLWLPPSPGSRICSDKNLPGPWDDEMTSTPWYFLVGKAHLEKIHGCFWSDKKNLKILIFVPTNQATLTPTKVLCRAIIDPWLLCFFNKKSCKIFHTKLPKNTVFLTSFSSNLKNSQIHLPRSIPPTPKRPPNFSLGFLNLRLSSTGCFLWWDPPTYRSRHFCWGGRDCEKCFHHWKWTAPK